MVIICSASTGGKSFLNSISLKNRFNVGLSDQTLSDSWLSVNSCLKLFLFANLDLEECVMKISMLKLNNKICIERENSEWSVYE